MGLRKAEWTYEQLGDAVSTMDETVEILRGLLKNSETLQASHPQAAQHIESILREIETVLTMKKQLTSLRVNFWAEFLGKKSSANLAAHAVAPFRKLA